MHGMHVDIDKKQTQIAYNSNEPHWENEHFEFPLRGFLPKKKLFIMFIPSIESSMYLMHCLKV